MQWFQRIIVSVTYFEEPLDKSLVGPGKYWESLSVCEEDTGGDEAGFDGLPTPPL